MATTPEERITILLHLLDDQLVSELMADLPDEQRKGMKSKMQLLGESPPTTTELERVLDEFERHFHAAFSLPDENEQAQKQKQREKERAAAEAMAESPIQVEAEFIPSDDPIADLNRISMARLSAALRDESPLVISLIAGTLTTERAGEVLEGLTGDVRDDVFMRLQEKPP
ncbi:MAG: hypothetical protein KDA60_07700, partial [Planctomycetales bacterium]|nr:hypothetical protein [Planctomycetales bacterium]